ncbi:hypothetical protein [Halomonas cupida]|uniref:hypothetical protein n=1 Tax=Halomonas cupida TaxID=44933 RepID=UPI003A958724
MRKSTVDLILAWVHVLSLLAFMGGALRLVTSSLYGGDWLAVLFMVIGGVGCWHWHKRDKELLREQKRMMDEWNGRY